ncbi:MAG: hypothetical protein WCD38_13545 [Candidatus Tumulicola sp.]
MFRYMVSAALAAGMLIAPIAAVAQGSGMSDSEYMAKILTAAPENVVKGATIVQMNADGSMRTLQTGTNGFTCMMLDVTPGCADQNAMAWMKALMTHSAPPDSVGFMYMLAGDSGASNTDPYARAQTATNHWVRTGPHVMVLGPAVKSMGYPMSVDPDPSKPYVMWADTPYAHAMLPVGSTPHM